MNCNQCELYKPDFNFCPNCGTPLTEPRPLTLDELRQMVDKPVWLETGQVSINEQIIGKYEILENINNFGRECFLFTRRVGGFFACNYGVTRSAYDRPSQNV